MKTTGGRSLRPGNRVPKITGEESRGLIQREGGELGGRISNSIKILVIIEELWILKARNKS
jgi:hypothetical protein